jgi:hypothetical protein
MSLEVSYIFPKGNISKQACDWVVVHFEYSEQKTICHASESRHPAQLHGFRLSPE